MSTPRMPQPAAHAVPVSRAKHHLDASGRLALGKGPRSLGRAAFDLFAGGAGYRCLATPLASLATHRVHCRQSPAHLTTGRRIDFFVQTRRESYNVQRPGASQCGSASLDLLVRAATTCEQERVSAARLGSHELEGLSQPGLLSSCQRCTNAAPLLGQTGRELHVDEGGACLSGRNALELEAHVGRFRRG